MTMRFEEFFKKLISLVDSIHKKGSMEVIVQVPPLYSRVVLPVIMIKVIHHHLTMSSSESSESVVDNLNVCESTEELSIFLPGVGGQD